jgi:hypothetical protein
MSDFWEFRQMITPVVIQVLYFLGVIALAIAGLAMIVIGAKHDRGRELGTGLALLVLGPLVLRIYAEVLIVAFKINESLTDLRALAVWTAEREHDYDKDDHDEDTDSTASLSEH